MHHVTNPDSAKIHKCTLSPNITNFNQKYLHIAQIPNRGPNILKSLSCSWKLGGWEIRDVREFYTENRSPTVSSGTDNLFVTCLDEFYFKWLKNSVIEIGEVV